MQKKTLIKLGGFVAAAAATAALVGFAANGTGAYFTGTQTGSINIGTGTVGVSITSPANGQLNFTNVLPGKDQSIDVNFTANTTESDGIDIYLEFYQPSPNGGNAGGDQSEAFTGYGKDATGGGLGRFGHFAVTSAPANNYGGASFESYNLSSNEPGDSSAPCPQDANGNGGDGSQGPFLDLTAQAPPYCAPIKPILLSYGLTNTSGGTAHITFGLTGRTEQGQNIPSYASVAYKIVAVEHNISPTDPDNAP